MEKAKIRLSEKELELVTDAEVILTKNTILQKAMLLLSGVLEKQKKFIQNNPGIFPEDVLKTPPKISKGENYLGLPYLILDYPRQFEKENTFAIRSMFWWGHFFSVTLHLSGRAKDAYESNIIAGWQLLKENGFYFCNNEDEWQHHFDKSNYLPVSSTSISGFESSIKKRPFIKLSKPIPVQEWDKAEDILFGFYTLLISLLDN